ncbi:retrovirus-related pol polyprotein from transposon TNT 1-94 [Tanacetum coccineum]
MQALKESKKISRRQPGTGRIPGVPDESAVIPATSSEGTGSEQESEYSKEGDDDEKIEWVDTDEEVEKNDDDDDKSIDLKRQKNKNFVHGDEQVNDDEDEEMTNAKVEESRNGDAKITDAAKADAEKTKEVLLRRTEELIHKYPPQASYKEMIEEFVQANLINENIVKNELEKTPLLVAQSSSQAQSSLKAVESFLDDAIAHGQVDPKKVLKKRDRDDEDPSAGPNQGKPPAKTSKSGKSVTVEELVEEPVFEMAFDDIEQTINEVELSAHCSPTLQNKLPPKETDPGSFILPCMIGNHPLSNALADLGASISIMPYSLFKRLELGSLKPIKMAIEMADRSIQSPRGVKENAHVGNSHAKIDVYGKKISLGVGNNQVVFTIDNKESPTSISPVFVINEFNNTQEFGSAGDFDDHLSPERASQDIISLSPSESTEIKENFGTTLYDTDKRMSMGLDEFVDIDDMRDDLDPGILTNEKAKTEFLKSGGRVYLCNPNNLQLSCKIGFVSFNPYFEPQTPFNIMSRKAYNTIMSHELMYSGNNLVGLAKNLHVFIGTHQDLVDFIILENISEFLEKGLTEVLFGQPFKEQIGLVEDQGKGTLWFKIGNDKILFHMPRAEKAFRKLTVKQHNSIGPLLKVSDEDKKKGIHKPERKIKGFYRGCLSLGDEYKFDQEVMDWIQGLLSDEQALHLITDQSASSPVKIEAPMELPKCFEIQKKQFLMGNYRLLDQIISQDIVNIVMNSSVDENTYVKVNSSIVMNDSVNYVEMCNKCLELKAKLIKQHNMVEKNEYNRLSKRFSELEQHCISLEIAMQLNKEIFQKTNTSVNQNKPSFDQLFELNNLKAELQAKETTIKKLKAHIKHINETSTSESVEKDFDEIETINIELEHRVTRLIAKNEHLKHTYKQLYDSIKPSRIRTEEQTESLVNQVNQKSVEIFDLNAQLQEKVFVITALKNDLRKLKGKDIVANAAQMSNAATITPEMYKLDPVILAPKVKNNREAHEYYLKHTIEQAAILRELIQELLGYVRDTCPAIHKPSAKLVTITPINKKKIVRFADTVTSPGNIPKVPNRPLLSSTEVNPSTSASRSKPSGNTKNDRIQQTPSSNEKNKVEVQSRKVKSSLNKRNSESKNVCNEHVKHPVKGVKALCSVCNECLFDANHAMITATNKVPLRVLTPLEVVAPEHVVIRVYTRRPKVNKSVQNSKPKVEKSMTANRMKHGTSWGSDNSVAPSSSSLIDCRDMMASSPICLLSKAIKTKSWLCHRRLSYLNFGAINHLVRHSLVRCLPRLKFEKDHLCPAYAMGKSKKQSHKPKSKDTNQEKLYLLHMDLYGPMCVASVNRKKYILVIVDDYSRFTWVKFLASKDEAPDFIIKFLKMIQVRLNATVRNIRTDTKLSLLIKPCETTMNKLASLMKHRWRKLHNKMVLLKGEIVRLKPDLSYLYVFGALCYPNNDSENLGKLQAKADIGIFIGYAPKKKAYHIYNRRTQKIIETILVNFDEMTTMDSEQLGSGPGLQCMTPATPMFDEFFSPPASVASPVPVEEAPAPVESTSLPSSTTVDQDAPSPSTSQTTPQSQSQTNPLSAEEESYDFEVAHMSNYPYFSISIPETISEESSSSDIEAMQEELHEFERIKVWELVPRPDKVMDITLKWIYKVKLDELGGILKNKARLVAHGYRQEMVVKTAFLNGILRVEVCVSHLDRFVDPDNPNHLYRLKKALYGLKQDPRAWYDLLSSFLLSQGFLKGTVDPTLFISRKGKDILLVQIYVDDIIFASTTTELLDTPMVEKSKLDEDTQGKAIDPTHYHGMVGTLIYLTSNRPDLVYAVSFADADHATRRSTSGSMQLLGDRLVSWMRSFTPEGSEELEMIAEELVVDLIMSSITAQQTKLDLELVPKEKRLEIGKCKGRLNPGKKQREPTFQVVLDVLALTPCYSAFLITADVPEVYMHQFWDTIHKVQGQNFDELPTDEDIVSFFKELGHTREIKSITDVVFKKPASPKLSTIPASPEEPTRKSKRVKRPAKKSSDAPTAGVFIRENPVKSSSKKKEKMSVEKRKGIDLLSEVALTEEAQYEEVYKKSLRDFHKTRPSATGTVTKIALSVAKIKPFVTNEGTSVKPGVPDATEEESTERSDSEHETNENESGSESDQEENEEEDETDEEEKNGEFVKTSSNDTDDEDETTIKDKTEGDEDEGMDYATNQFDYDVDIRMNEPVDTDKGFIQKEGTNAEMINVQQGNENLEISQVIEDAH